MRRTVRVIYLEDFDQAAGVAISVEGGIRFQAAHRLYKPLEGRLFKNAGDIADAAYAVANRTAAPR